MSARWVLRNLVLLCTGPCADPLHPRVRQNRVFMPDRPLLQQSTSSRWRPRMFIRASRRSASPPQRIIECAPSMQTKHYSIYKLKGSFPNLRLSAGVAAVVVAPHSSEMAYRPGVRKEEIPRSTASEREDPVNPRAPTNAENSDIVELPPSPSPLITNFLAAFGFRVSTPPQPSPRAAPRPRSPPTAARTVPTTIRRTDFSNDNATDRHSRPPIPSPPANPKPNAFENSPRSDPHPRAVSSTKLCGGEG